MFFVNNELIGNNKFKNIVIMKKTVLSLVLASAFATAGAAESWWIQQYNPEDKAGESEPDP